MKPRKSYCCHAPKTKSMILPIFFQLRDFIINQTTGDQKISVKYHYDDIVNNLCVAFEKRIKNI